MKIDLGWFHPDLFSGGERFFRESSILDARCHPAGIFVVVEDS